MDESSRLQRRKVKEKKAARKEKTAAMVAEREAAQADDSDDYDDDDEYAPSSARRGGRSAKGFLAGIKWKYVIMLLLLTGTAVLPAALWVIDSFFAASGKSAAVGLWLFYRSERGRRLQEVHEKRSRQILP